MKKILISILFILLAFNLSAQKNVRKEIRKGNKAYQEQRYGAAEESYHKALEENASSKEASFNLANSYYKQQRWDDALKEYQHYLTIENENHEKMSSAWSNIGNTYLKKKAAENSQLNMQMQQGQQPQKQQADNLDQSMSAYKNALRLNPADEATRYNLAVVQKMIQDRDKNKDQDKNQDKQDQKKDKQEQQQDKQQNQDNKNQDQQDQKKDKQEQQQENQMSQQNIQQILEAIEQDEKATQERVQQNKANEQKQKNQQNRKQNKDW